MFVVDAYLVGRLCTSPSRPHRVSASLLVGEDLGDLVEMGIDVVGQPSELAPAFTKFRRLVRGPMGRTCVGTNGLLECAPLVALLTGGSIGRRLRPSDQPQREEEWPMRFVKTLSQAILLFGLMVAPCLSIAAEPTFKEGWF